MKKLLVLLAFLPFMGKAQSLIAGKNIIKANLSSLAFGNYHVTYERSILKRMSISLSYRYMSKRALPLKTLLDNYIDNNDVDFGNFEMGNTAITPELRLYLGTGKMKGFYIAPYARFATFDLSVPVKYTASSLPGSPSKYAAFSGKIKSTSGGIMFGTQHQIFNKLVLDIWIVGGHYGTSSGDLNAVISPAMTPLEQSSLQRTLDDLKEVGPFKFESRVTSPTTAVATSTGPWAGIRALGISLGFRF